MGFDGINPSERGWISNMGSFCHIMSLSMFLDVFRDSIKVTDHGNRMGVIGENNQVLPILTSSFLCVLQLRFGH